MGAVKDMLMDVEDFVYGFYDKDGQMTETVPVVVAKAKQKFGVTFGEYAEEVLNGNEGPVEPDYMREEMEYRQSLAEINDGIPF
jgi:hypothetical protein